MSVYPEVAPKNEFIKKLQDSVHEIKLSYLHDLDKTDEIIKITNFLQKILLSEKLFEDNFDNNTDTIKYFTTSFLKELISYITVQNMVYGDNGDELAVELLYTIYKLFLKYHKEIKYSQMFEVIREIMKPENSLPNFFKPISDQRNNTNVKTENIKRKYNSWNYNQLFCKEFIDTSKQFEKLYKIGEKVDVLINYKKSRQSLDRRAWVRGEIKSIDEENMQYIVDIPTINEKVKIQIGGRDITKEGEKTKDWEWRLNLKEYDVVDCFDRSKWFPSTITRVKDEGKLLHIGFRLYPKRFKNPNDDKDTYENYKCFWGQNALHSKNSKNDKDNKKEKEEYLGDHETYDEDIEFYSKRIQPFQSYTNIQRNFLDVATQYYARGYAVKSDIKNEMQRMNYELENDEVESKFNFDDIITYELNGKKNYIVGKTPKFNYYYALFWKKLADDNVFEKFLEIINDKPNGEEIYMILYTIYCAMPYLHKQYLIENLAKFKSAMINFINNLDTKEIRNLPKNLTEIFNKFLKNINDIINREETDIKDMNNENSENKNNMSNTMDEISIRLSLKMLKTSIFDKRMQGIKLLNEFITDNISKQKEDSINILIDLLQKNEIINEIFGPNYHSQIISKTDKILELLLKNNKVQEDDIKLIWDCAQRGDLEAKNIIMKLLSDLAGNLNENFINILLENVINKIDEEKMNEQDIDFIYNLSIHGDNENNKKKCLEYLYQCILKLDLNTNNENDIKNNQIIYKLLNFTYNDDKYLNTILSFCENDLKKNNNSLIVFEILSILLDKFTISMTEITYLKDPVQTFTSNEHLLNLYQENFINYIQRIKAQIKTKEEKNISINYDEEIIDNYTHVINIKKRIEFLNNWITLIYPSFDFVPFLKNILLKEPISNNDEIIFDEFIQKYITETTTNENKIRKEKKENMKKQLFTNFIENDQSNMSYSEFKLFISIFLGINSTNICYIIDSNDNYDIKLSCNTVEEIKDLDKFWNIIFQLKEEKVLNKAINIIFNIYKSKNEIEKLLHKCKELINENNSSDNNETKNINNLNEVINKCFKLLRMIILESEKNLITKTKSHFNLLKNCYIYFPIKLVPKYPNIYYNNIPETNGQNPINEIIYGNTTINELKELLIEKEKIPLKIIEINLSKEYTKENEVLLDETYNNKSILEILNDNNNNYSKDLPLDKIFIFYSRNIEKENLLTPNGQLNPKLESILKEWFSEFTHGEEKMDVKACSEYISKVTGVREITNITDSRVTEFFKDYDKDNTGYITLENFLEFYLDAIKTNREDTVWENLKAMDVREDLHKKSEKYPIPYSENDTLPRYSLGNDKIFVENLFNLFNKCDGEKEIFEFLFFLSTNKDIYDDILNNLNNKEENNFEKIFELKKNLLQSLYILYIIESILQDINITYTDINFLQKKFITNENGVETTIELNQKKYEYFDEIDINKKKNFIKEFIINKNYEKLLKYLNELLLNYKYDKSDEKNNNNFILNLCCEKCLNIINIIYNATKETISEKENNDNNTNNNSINNIVLFDYNNLFNFINNEEENIKQTIESINFFDYVTTLIKFIDQINKGIKPEDQCNQNNLLKNSFTLMINLISNNDKLITELYSNNETKTILENLIKSIFNTTNENYKLFYINCLLNLIKTSQKNSSNKFLNLLFELTNDIIFNKIMKNNYIDKTSDKSSTLFFEFFSVLTAKMGDNIGNDFLLQIYNFIYDKLDHIEDDTNISKDIFLGLMNILIKRIKLNEEIKNIIINKEIKGKTLLDLILDIFYKKEEEKENTDKKNDDKEKQEEEQEEVICLDNVNDIDNNNNTNNNNEENKKKKEIDYSKEDYLINIEEIKKIDINSQKKEIPYEIKEICSQYLLEAFRFSSSEKILNKIISIIKLFPSEKSSESKNEEIMKKMKSPPSFKKHGHVGLKNLGCICYMNSILQQIYMVPTFRYAIMGFNGTNINELPDNDDSLNQLQIMYSYLTLSEKEDYNPKNFCKAFKDYDGNPINVMVQQDSQEFFNNFFDKMENNLKKTKYKYIINDVFSGRTCSSVICDSCKHVSNRFEDFYNLTLEVKNISNLTDSLHKLITPEKIEDFKCSNCNKNVTINKRTSLSDLPNVLVFHLKRFYMNYEIERTEKINSRFEFPLNINMKEFCIEDIDFSGKKFENDDIYIKDDSYYLYELKGINIHMGSADGGHYFSVINTLRGGCGNVLLENEKNENTENNIWLKFNDSHISVFDINDIEKECFGGSKKGLGFNYENFQNAYMLIYERKNKTPIRYRYDEDEFNKIFNIEKEQENIVKINNENKAKIKKMYNLAKKEDKINENILYQKKFFDEDKKEYYKYIPFYSIEKKVPKYLYEQVMEKNSELYNQKNKENEANNHKKDFNDILLNNINTSEFNIINYTEEIKSDLINILIEELFPKDQYLYEEERTVHNKKTKIILEKIILPFINIEVNKDIKEENKNSKIISMIFTLLMDKEKLKRIYTKDLTAIFDNTNIEIFSNIIKALLDIYKTKNTNKYLSLIETLLNIIQEIDSTETYPKKAKEENTPLFHVYQILYEQAIKDKKVITKLVNQSCISELLGKLTSENKKNKDIIFDIVLLLLKNLDDYNEVLFDVEKKEKNKIYFFEKQYLIKNISPIFIELLFNEKVELLIILLKLLQYDHPKFSHVFNSQSLTDLFVYSTNINKISDMNKVLFALLEINDKYTFDRLNYILGYPTPIIKEIKYNDIKAKKNEKKNNLYDEEEKENEIKEKIEQEKIKYDWPLFGERLIKENLEEKKDKKILLKKHIFKYISYSHKHDDFCLLSRLMPELDDNGDIVNFVNKKIEQKERNDLIYALLKLMLIGKGNYTVFKYIYLSPARCIYYNNLFEEMLDILEEENKKSDKIIYNLSEIKKNAEICIKRIKYEVDTTLNYLTGNAAVNDENECELPEKMKKYFVQNDDVEKFIGSNPNFIPGDIIKEKILILAMEGGMYLLRLEYVTEIKTLEEIRNSLLLEESKENKENNENKKEDDKKDENKENKKDEKTKDINISENNKENENNDNENKDSDIDIIRDKEIYISEVNNELDKNKFLREILRKHLFSKNKVIIKNNNKKKAKGKSSLIRFIMLNITPQQSPMQIQITQKDIPDDVKENYYYQLSFWDLLKAEDASNFLNINRIRSDLPFLKKNHIGININIKKNRGYEA